jgi:transposase InsO family protein
VAFVKLYDRKNALVAADLLNSCVMPFFEEHEIPLLRVLSDRGTEYCGNREHHEYQLYLAIENIDHSKTKARSPQTNGICERFQRTMLEEFYQIAFRKKLYHSLEEIQTDADEWLLTYNQDRPHSGRYCYGKTPMETFKESIKMAKDKIIDNLSDIPMAA